MAEKEETKTCPKCKGKVLKGLVGYAGAFGPFWIRPGNKKGFREKVS